LQYEGLVLPELQENEQMKSLSWDENSQDTWSTLQGDHAVQYFVTLEENASPGTVVLQLLAIDPDEGRNAEIQFSIQSGDEGIFSIETSSGKLVLNRNLRNVRRKLFKMQISATDGGGKKCRENAIVEILVKSANPNVQLKFEQEIYSFDIMEDNGSSHSGDREVGQLRLIEANKRPTKYSIVGGDSYGVFSIEESTGTVRAVKSLDREKKGKYLLVVVARQDLSYGICVIQVTIQDLNDNPPTFPVVKRITNVQENVPVGADLLPVKAMDMDQGVNAKIQYDLETNPDDLFVINNDNGLISLKKSLRLASKQQLELVVRAFNENDKKLFSKQTVLVHIEDVNDHTPVFDHSSYETSLLETTSVNTRFFELQASDQDLGRNAQIEYEILEGNGANKFGIFPDGYLFVKSSLDREEQDYFSLTVTARDHGDPQRSSTVSVIVHVIDTNDNAPKFTNATFTFYIDENDSAGTYVGKVSATDEDVGRNAELTYLLSGSSTDFVMDMKNGFVKNLRVFDREQLLETTGKDYISQEVIVQDSGVIRLKDKAEIRIYVTDVNDNRPIFMRSSYSTEVSEGAPVPSAVIRVTATDLDEGLNGDIMYFISGGNEDEIFNIDATTGQISLAKRLDRESQEEYLLQITAQDTGESEKLSSTVPLSITVLDENDNAPEFTHSEASISISETTPVNTELIRFQASDPDLGVNQEVSLSITGGNRHDTFRMNPATGSLYLHKPLDYEKYTSYTLNISALDGGNPQLSSSVEFLILIEDFNDNVPIFPSTAIVRQIQEGIAINSPIVTVSAEDPDSGFNGHVSYSIKEQEPSGAHFGIDKRTGRIFTLKEIDREFADTFRLTVVAIDGAERPDFRLSSEKLVTVIVEDTNDNEPKFMSMNAALLHSDGDKSLSQEVCTVRAVDADSGSNGVVTYELINGDGTLFSLDRNTGSLRLRRLIRKLQPRYQLTVRATDEAIQSQRKSSDLYLTLLGMDEGSDGRLEFSDSEYKASLYENEPIGTLVTTVQCPGDNVEYYVTNVTSAKNGSALNRWFDVDLKRGMVSVADLLDREMGLESLVVEIYAIVVSSGELKTAKTKVRNFFFLFFFI